MIRAGAKTSPREALAQTLGGTLIGRDAILVDGLCVWASVTGVVRVGGTVLGAWSDSTEALASRFREVTGQGAQMVTTSARLLHKVAALADVTPVDLDGWLYAIVPACVGRPEVVLRAALGGA